MSNRPTRVRTRGRPPSLHTASAHLAPRSADRNRRKPSRVEATGLRHVVTCNVARQRTQQPGPGATGRSRAALRRPSSCSATMCAASRTTPRFAPRTPWCPVHEMFRAATCGDTEGCLGLRARRDSRSETRSDSTRQHRTRMQRHVAPFSPSLRICLIADGTAAFQRTLEPRQSNRALSQAGQCRITPSAVRGPAGATFSASVHAAPVPQ